MFRGVLDSVRECIIVYLHLSIEKNTSRMHLIFSVASPSERRDAIGVVQIDLIGLDGCNICWFNPRDGASGRM